MTTFGDQVFQYGGTPVNGFMTTGKVWFVKPNSGSDSNKGNKPSQALKTLTKAQSLATADKGDVVYMVTESDSASSTTDYQSSVLTWAKDGVHLIGIGARPFMGQRSRVSNLSTAATFTNLFTLSADGCYVAGLEFFQGSMATNAAASHYAVQVSGIRNRVENCQISGVGHADLDDAGSRSLYVTGRENYFNECYIGLDTIIRATATAEIEVTNVARTIFDRCMVNSWTDNRFYSLRSHTFIQKIGILKRLKKIYFQSEEINQYSSIPRGIPFGIPPFEPEDAITSSILRIIIETSVAEFIA